MVHEAVQEVTEQHCTKRSDSLLGKHGKELKAILPGSASWGSLRKVWMCGWTQKRQGDIRLIIQCRDLWKDISLGESRQQARSASHRDDAPYTPSMGGGGTRYIDARIVTWISVSVVLRTATPSSNSKVL
jgi:hypothetical protein